MHWPVSRKQKNYKNEYAEKHKVNFDLTTGSEEAHCITGIDIYELIRSLVWMIGGPILSILDSHPCLRTKLASELHGYQYPITAHCWWGGDFINNSNSMDIIIVRLCSYDCIMADKVEVMLFDNDAVMNSCGGKMIGQAVINDLYS